jgi:hypothetical protein
VRSSVVAFVAAVLLCACTHQGSGSRPQQAGLTTGAAPSAISRPSRSEQCNSSFVADYGRDGGGQATAKLAMAKFVSYGSQPGFSADPSTYVELHQLGPDLAFRSGRGVVFASRFKDGTWYVGHGFTCH